VDGWLLKNGDEDKTDIQTVNSDLYIQYIVSTQIV